VNLSLYKQDNVFRNDDDVSSVATDGVVCRAGDQRSSPNSSNSSTSGSIQSFVASGFGSTIRLGTASSSESW
jgi:hypothetical protein